MSDTSKHVPMIYMKFDHRIILHVDSKLFKEIHFYIAIYENKQTGFDLCNKYHAFL